MGVLVLNPQDCLQNPVSSRQGLLSPPRVKLPRNPNPNPNRLNRAQLSRRKRSPNISPPSRAATASTQASPAKSLVLGQVKILKRGEQLSKTTPEKAPQPAKTERRDEDLDLGSTDCLGLDPEQLTKTTVKKAPQPAKSERGDEDVDLGSTNRLGPDPKLVPTQICLTESNLANGFYAGSAFVTSPPPSSLPLPAFFMKKSVGVNKDYASSELCKLLGLNL